MQRKFLARELYPRSKLLQGCLKCGEVYSFLAAHDGIVVVEYETADVAHEIILRIGSCMLSYHTF